MLSLLGVCNTDNFSLLSITIDYGPFGFMDDYDPGNIVWYNISYTHFSNSLRSHQVKTKKIITAVEGGLDARS